MKAVGMSSQAKYECLLFDMDDTLYPMSLGLNLACRRNIEEFMLQQLHMEENEVPRMCLELYREFGTTMAGLKAIGYEFDSDEFHAYVHGKLPYDALKPDPVLRNLLQSMRQRKIIFTNADQAHAAQVLRRLGLEDCFEGVICFETLNNHHDLEPVDDCVNGANDQSAVADEKEGNGSSITDSADQINTFYSSFKPQILCKPSLEAIEAAIQIANVDPKKTIFFDDSVRNIEAGKAAGLHTVIVGSSILVPGADHALTSIHNIKEALPEIWEGEEDKDQHLQEHLIQSTSGETVVLA